MERNETEEEEENKLDLSDNAMKRIPRLKDLASLSKVTGLNLDNNNLYKLENMHQFPSVVEFSARHNSLPRMYGLSVLVHLVKVDLSNNNIIMIEGLKELVHLTHLNLSSNKIKAIDGLQTNQQLEYLDLSENKIVQIEKLNCLTLLKKLFLQKNMIPHLLLCEVYLPQSIEVLNLAQNHISDLTEISHLVNLINLKDLSIAENPCLIPLESGSEIPYRPYLLNWCTQLTVIDGFAAGEIESLQGEWLYSQGNGRKFKKGQHKELAQYLLENCAIGDEKLDSCEERKLKVVLSKARQYKSQVKLVEQGPSDIMSKSLDPSLLDCESVAGKKLLERQRGGALSMSLCEQKLGGNIFTDLNPKTPKAVAPLPAASKMVPVPESLISPMVTSLPALVMPSPSSTNISTNYIPARSSSESAIQSNTIPGNKDTISPCKLKTIKSKVDQKRVEDAQLSEQEKAAIRIQRSWKGYKARSNPQLRSLYEQQQTSRTNEYIRKLCEDMELTKAALENDHKLQLLQMQAINALWRKVVTLQPATKDAYILQLETLGETCDRLSNQVQQLQTCMNDIMRCISPSGNSTAIATQTDVVAVNTPCDYTEDNQFLQSRPSSLALPNQDSVPEETNTNPPNNEDNNED